MIAGISTSDVATFVIVHRHASLFPTRARSSDHTHRKDSPATQKSRDELPPILAGLQWVWTHPTLKAGIFALLEQQRTGRTGMDLWQILVLGVARLGLDADWDRMEHIANYDTLVRQMLGVPMHAVGRERQSIRPSDPAGRCALLDEELLQQINARIAAAGREVFAKKAARPSRRLKSRWTPTCWKPTCISRPI